MSAPSVSWYKGIRLQDHKAVPEYARTSCKSFVEYVSLSVEMMKMRTLNSCLNSVAISTSYHMSDEQGPITT